MRGFPLQDEGPGMNELFHDLSVEQEQRFVNCEVCQTEGRIYTSNGGPDEIDNGPCPACEGECVVEVETQPVDLEDFHCPDCGQSLPLLYPCLQQGCPQ